MLHDQFLGSGDGNNRFIVIWSLDYDGGTGGEWQVVSNYGGVGIQGDAAIRLLRKTFMIVTATPSGNLTAAFDVGGLEEHLPKVQEACHWS